MLAQEVIVNDNAPTTNPHHHQEHVILYIDFHACGQPYLGSHAFLHTAGGPTNLFGRTSWSPRGQDHLYSHGLCLQLGPLSWGADDWTGDVL